MTNLAIRRARPEDAATLSALAVASKRHWGYDDAFIAATISELAVSPDQLNGDDCYLAETDGTVVGFYLLEESSLERMFVNPNFMRQGVGRDLVRHLFEHARRRGVPVVTIIVDPNAAGFYRKMGAIETGRIDSPFIAERQLPIFEWEIMSD